MKLKPVSEAAVMLVGYNAWALAMLLRGFDAAYLPLLVMFTLLGFSQASRTFPFLTGLSLIALFSPSLMPMAVLIGGALACATAYSMRTRITGLIAVASTIWFLPLSNAIPIIVLAAVTTLTLNCRIRSLLLPVALIVSVFWTGLPGPLSGEQAIAHSRINDGKLTYTVQTVDLSTREVLLPAPCTGTWALWVALDGGGVRDSLPMMAIRLGDDMLVLPSGRDTLCFTMIPGDTLAITMMRDFKPFNHPVIHTTAGGERL